MEPTRLLERYVAMHNEGVVSGSFSGMLALFHPDAVMTFDGLPVGPFVGVPAIAAAFGTQPPKDLLILMSPPTMAGRMAGCMFSWESHPEVLAGRILLHADSGQIRSLTVRSNAQGN